MTETIIIIVAYVLGVVALLEASDIGNGTMGRWDGAVIMALIWPLWGVVLLVAIPIAWIAYQMQTRIIAGGNPTQLTKLDDMGFRPRRFVGIMHRSWTIGFTRWERRK